MFNLNDLKLDFNNRFIAEDKTITRLDDMEGLLIVNDYIFPMMCKFIDNNHLKVYGLDTPIWYSIDTHRCSDCKSNGFSHDNPNKLYLRVELSKCNFSDSICYFNSDIAKNFEDIVSNFYKCSLVVKELIEGKRKWQK